MTPLPIVALALSLAGCIKAEGDTGAPPAPLAVAVTLSPEQVTTDTLVQATVEITGGEGAPSFAWAVDGIAAGEDSDSLDGALHFQRDQTLALTVTVVTADGATAAAAAGPLVVANSPPQVSDITLIPQTVYTEDTLAGAVSASDPDGDPVSLLYTWMVDDSPVGGVYEPVLEGWAFEKGQSVALRVLPSDGDRDGALVTSEPVIVLNTPPTAPVIDITPEDPATTDDLTCAVLTAAEDADGDALTTAVSWTVDGAPWTGPVLDGAHTGDTVAADQTGRDQTWGCTVTVDDGEASAPPISSEALVGAPCGQTITVAYLPSWFDWTWADLAWGALSADAADFGCNAVEFRTVSHGFDEAELAGLGAAVLLTSWPAADAQAYTPAEIAAVEAALRAGAGLVVTGMVDWREGVSALGLAPLLGVDAAAVVPDYTEHALPIDILDPAHPLTADLPASIGLSTIRLTQSFSGGASASLLKGASIVMASAGEEEVVIAYEGDWRGAWFTGLPDFQVDNDDSLQALYNALNWTAGY